MDNNKHTAATHAFYDEERELHYCYVGLNDKRRTLKLTVWGDTPEQAIEEAKRMAELLNSKK